MTVDKPFRWLIGGVLLGAIAVVPIAIHDSNHSGNGASQARKDARAFVKEYRLSRNSHFRAAQEFKRLKDGVPVIGFEIIIDQDPPRYSNSSGSNQHFIFAGYQVNCAKTDVDLQCSKQSAASWPEMVDGEARDLENYFFSSAPIYSVKRQKNDCFQLQNIYPEYPSPPYGDSARFCFDKKTHVPVSKDVVRGHFSDVNEYTNIAAPQEADFKLPAEAKNLP